ncbi:universal stress protein [Oxalobacteraceae bacterium R-40]|uniref:Universal stress protein n=1 Tax=Keguizhuia sedimenti TaxID=3064264 RepID=A0ABU1BQE9_9BURK|nr:universal stress protein [Oxalobacteraceae bacterium R-40]
MSYKTILVHVDDAPSLEARLETAFRIADSESGHVIGAAATGISRLIFQASDGVDAGMAECIDTMLDSAKAQAVQSLDRFENFARARGLSYERKLVEDEPHAGLSRLAQYSDLAIVGQADRDDPASTSIINLPEYIALGSGRPVLVVPASGTRVTPPRRVLIGWNASPSAAHAVMMALPFLKRASHVDLAVFNPVSNQNVQTEESCADLTKYLARHGVNANTILKETRTDIGSALLQMAAEQNADMLVMGCYGHTRFREILLGGATRTVLEAMTIPVTMAH